MKARPEPEGKNKTKSNDFRKGLFQARDAEKEKKVIDKTISLGRQQRQCILLVGAEAKHVQNHKSKPRVGELTKVQSIKGQ